MSPHSPAPTTSVFLALGVLVVATVLLQLGTPEPTSRESGLARAAGCPGREWAAYDAYGREGRELDAEMNALMDRLMAATTRHERNLIKWQVDAVRLRWEALRATITVRLRAPPLRHGHGHGYRISDECLRNPLQKACM